MKKYVGIWATEDGYTRQELLPGRRYDEARGDNRSLGNSSEVHVLGLLIVLCRQSKFDQ